MQMKSPHPQGWPNTDLCICEQISSGPAFNYSDLHRLTGQKLYSACIALYCTFNSNFYQILSDSNIHDDLWLDHDWSYDFTWPMSRNRDTSRPLAWSVKKLSAGLKWNQANGDQLVPGWCGGMPEVGGVFSHVFTLMQR